MADAAPFASLCCPGFALRSLTPDELRHLYRYCQRALDDPEAEPRDGAEAAAVARYEALLTSATHWRREA